MDVKVKRPLNELGAAELAQRIAVDEATCEGVVRDCLARIAAHDDVVKAWVNFNPELALTQARVATIPLSVFYEHPPPMTLLRLCVAKRDQTLIEAASRLVSYAQQHARRSGVRGHAP